MTIDPEIRINVSNLVKIHITIVDDVIAGELLWALPLGGELYEIMNIPFDANCCSLGDVVKCVHDPVAGQLEFVGLVERRSTGYWKLLFSPTVSGSQRTSIIEELKAAGGHLEGAEGSFFVMASLRPTDPGPLTTILFHHMASLRFEYYLPR